MKFRTNLLITVFCLLTTLGCQKSANVVVVYVSEDQVFSEPILNDFQRETGIKVRAIFDTEEAKGTGVMNRLLAEKDNPQADVYWANEPVRAELLKKAGVSAPYISPNAEGIPSNFKDSLGYWTGFSARARVFIVNSSSQERPISIFDYIFPQWRERAAIANPLFGTTSIHIAILSTMWGEEQTKKFFEELLTNQIVVSTSNGESADFVANHKVDWALVDSDDAINRIRQGLPVLMILPDQHAEGMGVLVIPNAVLLVKNCPHTDNGKKLVDYLLSIGTEQKLALADCAQIPIHADSKMPKELLAFEKMKILSVDYRSAAEILPRIQTMLKECLH